MPTGKGFTPIIGLAVVVALAMAAVFGAMSLTNPAFAAVGAPADSQLAERTNSPQVDGTTVTVYVGGAQAVSLLSYVEERILEYNAIVVMDASGNDDLATVTLDNAPRAIGVVYTGVAPGSFNARIPITFTAGTPGRIDVDLQVTVLPAVPATNNGLAANKTVEQGRLTPAADDDDEARLQGPAVTIPMSGFFTPGKGSGVIESYSMPIPTGSYASKGNASGITVTINKMTGVVTARATATATVNQTVTVTVTAETDHTDDPSQQFYIDVVAEGTGPTGPSGPMDPDLPKLTPGSIEPGDGTRYDIEFETTADVNTLTDELIIKLDDFELPSTIATRSVAIIVTDAGTKEKSDSTDPNANRDFIPEDVTVSGSKIIITLGDMDKGDNNEDFGITGGSIIKVVLRQSAGISNPSEAKGYGPVIELGDLKLDWEDENDDGDPMFPDLVLDVPRIIGLDEEDGGLGTVVNATGSGYKNGTSLIVFVDKLSPVMWDNTDDNRDNMVPLPANMVDEYDMRVMMDSDYGNVPADTIPSDDGMATYYDEDDNALAPNRKLDLGEDELCQVGSIGGDDTGTCEFTVTHPTFSGGINYINAVDGRSGYVDDGEDLGEFDLTASLTASPAGGSPGEIMLIQVVDFPFGNIKKVEIARNEYCSGVCGTVDRAGSGNFKVTIPNWVNGGTQELRVTGENDAAGDPVRASTNVSLAGPQILVTPGTVLANQRISLVGTGFSPNSEIDDDVDLAKVSVGGDQISWGRVNEGEQVDVDSGGNWSASVDLPLTEATTAEGERVIRVTDSHGRTGTVMVNIPAREVTVTPSVSRVGTIAVVRGSGFPSKNDEGTSFNIEIVYDASNDKTTTVSAVPDASGRFEVQLRIPTTAAIPSNNTVKVTFEDESGIAVVTTVAHEVPEGVITLSTTSGGPGSTVTINGEGFKAFVPVSLVKIGTLDVTPAPKPSTDGNGMMSFAVTIPGLDVGIQTIEVNVGRTTSSTGFTVTESGVSPGNIKEVAVGLEPLGDNFVSVWHFNNDTKMWSFYAPALAEGNTLTHVITGETYLIRIKSTTEVILNNDTRNLTCVGDNCWNQLVW